MKAIVQNGDPVLREQSQPVSEEQFGTKELAAQVKDMVDALDAATDGVALAAPQIGISLRIFVVRYDRLHPPPEGSPLPPDVGVFINPEFTRVSRRREVMDEGCHERATVRARAEDGSRFERGGGGILAQVYQHEIDHLDGVLFIDDAIDTYEPSKNNGGANHEHEYDLDDAQNSHD
jgi:peptide deformylase